jgi:hypothetical protein
MARKKNGKKSSKKKHTKKKPAVHAGFAQRTVQPTGSKSGGWLSALGGVAKHLVGKVLDGLALVQPELAPLRALAKAHYGFAERDVQGSGAPSDIDQRGGAVVSVEDAPVAFARKPIQCGMHMLGKTQAGQVMWLRDQISGSLTTAATAATYSVGYKYLIPTQSTLFPNYYQEFYYWDRWRPLKAILHYCHFAPTSTQVAVMLGYCPQPNIAIPETFTSTNEFMGNQFAVQGSAYEDFALVIEDPQWKEGTWFGNYTSASVGAAFNATGQLVWATDANSLAQAIAIGFLYAELIFEVCDRRPAYGGAGLLAEFKLASQACKSEEEFNRLHALTLKKLDSIMLSDRKKTLANIRHLDENSLLAQVEQEERDSPAQVKQAGSTVVTPSAPRLALRH